MTDSAKPVDVIDLASVPSNSKRCFDLKAAVLGDGSLLRVPINIVAGHHDGPCLTLVAGIHGDEADGIMALMELWQDLDPASLSGRVMIVPVANPTAFIAGQRRSPLDDLDLNRTFPGDPEGQPSQQLAHALLHQVLKRSDFVFSMHGWYASGITVPYVEYAGCVNKTAAASYRAAVAAGFEMIWDCPWPDGLMTYAANREGVPGMEAEVGGMGTTSAENRRLYKSYIHALMRHMEMMAGKLKPGLPPRHVEGIDLVSPVGGMVTYDVTIGERIAAGARLARVSDFHGAIVHEVRAPADGLVAGIRTAAAVPPGGNLFRLFRDAE